MHGKFFPRLHTRYHYRWLLNFIFPASHFPLPAYFPFRWYDFQFRLDGSMKTQLEHRVPGLVPRKTQRQSTFTSLLYHHLFILVILLYLHTYPSNFYVHRLDEKNLKYLDTLLNLPASIHWNLVVKLFRFNPQSDFGFCYPRFIISEIYLTDLLLVMYIVMEVFVMSCKSWQNTSR